MNDYMNLRQKKKLGKLKETAKITDFSQESPYCSGICGKYLFEAKLFDEGSCFGIDNGRVSKLLIYSKNGHLFDPDTINYDRGWDLKPNAKNQNAYNAIMELLENAPKRFS